MVPGVMRRAGVVAQHGTHAYLPCAAQVGQRVVNEHDLVRGYPQAGEQLAHHGHRRLAAQTPLQPHVVDRPDRFEFLKNAQRMQHPAGVAVWRVREHDLAPGQAREHACKAALAMHHSGHVEVVAGFEKGVCGNAMVPFQADDGGAVAAPVIQPKRIGAFAIEIQPLHHGVGHRAIDGAEDMSRAVVQGVVEVEEPDGFAGAWPGRAAQGAPCAQATLVGCCGPLRARHPLRHPGMNHAALSAT